MPGWEFTTVRLPVPEHPPGNLFDRRRPERILLSQGAVRPGMVQGQHWGHPPQRPELPLPPEPDFSVNVDVRI